MRFATCLLASFLLLKKRRRQFFLQSDNSLPHTCRLAFVCDPAISSSWSWVNVNIFSDFTSLSLLPPVPDEVAGGLSGSSVKMNAEKMCDSAVQQGAAEWKGNSSPHTLASGSSSLRDENRPFMGGAVQPTSRDKGLFILFSRNYFD